MGQGHVLVDQIVQSLVQLDLEHFQGWDTHNFSGKPVPVSCHPHCRKCLPYVQSKSTLFQFKTITPCLIPRDPGKKSLSVFLISPVKY